VYNREKRVKRINALSNARNAVERFGCTDCKRNSTVCSTDEFVFRGGEGEWTGRRGVSGDHSEKNTEAAESIEVEVKFSVGSRTLLGWMKPEGSAKARCLSGLLLNLLLLL
jgi:hypothetical protein